MTPSWSIFDAEGAVLASGFATVGAAKRRVRRMLSWSPPPALPLWVGWKCRKCESSGRTESCVALDGEPHWTASRAKPTCYCQEGPCSLCGLPSRRYGIRSTDFYRVNGNLCGDCEQLSEWVLRYPDLSRKILANLKKEATP